MAFRIQCQFLTGDSREIDEEVAKEWEHTILQNSMDKELNELNRRLEEKEVLFIRIYIFYVLFLVFCNFQNCVFLLH